MWDRIRIDREHELKQRFGLKNLRELWKATTEISRIRRNVREVLAGRAREQVGNDIIARLARYSIVSKEAKLDDLLGLTPEAILNRRLQSVVFKKGLAKTPRQSRQLIAHGFISIDGRKVRSPGYLVTSAEESKIGYYKPINLEPQTPNKPPEAAGVQAAEAPSGEAKEAPKQENN